MEVRESIHTCAIGIIVALPIFVDYPLRPVRESRTLNQASPAISDELLRAPVGSQ